jgi:hypothetical protein
MPRAMWQQQPTMLAAPHEAAAPQGAAVALLSESVTDADSPEGRQWQTLENTTQLTATERKVAGTVSRCLPSKVPVIGVTAWRGARFADHELHHAPQAATASFAMSRLGLPVLGQFGEVGTEASHGVCRPV